MHSGRSLVAGTARGPLLVLDEPLSFWGGVDPQSGTIIDPHHPQRGQSVAGIVLALPTGRGSSSSSSVLAEAIRLGTAPAALLLAAPDLIVVLGALAARELYGRTCPIVVLDPADYATLESGISAEVRADGAVVIRSDTRPTGSS
jgi:predicted aconitase with swiveling domain